MAHHFEFDSDHRVLLLVLEGDVDGSEIGNVNNEIKAHVTRLKPASGISDFTAVRTLNVSAESMRRAALEPSPYPPETPRFIVAPTDFLFGMARMYELVANRPNENLKVVRTREEVLAAVGVRNPKFERLD